MLQSNVLFEAYSYYSGIRERNPFSTGIKHPNSTLLAEGEGVTATCLGQLPSRGGIIITRSLRIIHRVPSVKGVTATCLGTFLIIDKHIEIYRKNAPNRLSLCNYNKTRRIAHGA